MNIVGIKQAVNIPELLFIRQMDETDPNNPVPSEWVSHWDDNKRVRVAMHNDVLNVIKNDPTVATLAVKKQVVVAHKSATSDEMVAEYTRFVVIIPANIELAI